MVQRLKQQIEPYQWALPETLNIPPDELKVRMDFYQDSIILYLLDKGVITTRQVSAQDISLAVLSEVSLNSGILPVSTLWWKQGKYGAQVALWRAPKTWPVALQTESFKPARRFKLPMPGLVFLCTPGNPPLVYAAKKRPKKPGENIYHAPLFNVYQDGRTCPGTHRYPYEVEKIPESFFTAFFTPAAMSGGRSKQYPNDLLKLWEEIDGKARYPMDDLVKAGTIADIMQRG